MTIDNKDAYAKVKVLLDDDVARLYADGLLEEARKEFAEYLHRQAIDFLTLLRRLHPDVEYAGQNGKCFVVSKLLCDRFVGEIWYDVPGHITTKIGERHYDITGEVSPHPSAYRLTDELVLKRAEEWDKDWRDQRMMNFLMDNGTYQVKCVIDNKTSYRLYVNKHGVHYANYTVYDPGEAQQVLKDLGFTEIMFKT